MIVVGLASTPNRLKTPPVVSTPAHPAIFLLAKKLCTTFGSSSSTKMNWNLAKSSVAASLLRSGISATQGPHQVAQNSSTTTLPRKLCQSAFAPGGACSSCVNCNGGAGVPFSGSAHTESDPKRTVAKITRQRGQRKPQIRTRLKLMFAFFSRKRGNSLSLPEMDSMCRTQSENDEKSP